MKTFIEFLQLQEDNHYYGRYNQWGMINTRNKMINGLTTTGARIHYDLRPEFKQNNRVVDYFQEKQSKANPQRLVIRTYSLPSLDRAIKNFDRMPHIDTGNVMHTHSRGDEYIEHSGNRDEVLKQMIKYRDSLLNQ